MPKCPICGKPAKLIDTHHLIPRYLSISSDDDTIECCRSCHRKFDIKFKNLLLWGTFSPPSWNNKQKEYLAQRRWVKNNPDKVKRAQRKYREKKRRERGIEHTPNITTRYPNLQMLKEELTDFYWNNNLSMRETTVAMGLSESCVDRWMRRLDVPRRTQSAGCRNYHRRDKVELIAKAKQLRQIGLTCYRIAKQLNVSNSQAWRLSHIQEACEVHVEIKGLG